MNEFDHPGARWLGAVASASRGALSKREKLVIASMDIDQALRVLEQHAPAMRAAEAQR